MEPVAPARRRWLKTNLVAAVAAIAAVGAGAASAATSGGGGVGPDETSGTEPAPTGVAPTAEGVFPVRGRHQYGDGFGAGRGHEGQDVFAKCGTKLVAAQGGRIQVNKSHSAAGNYVVIDVKGSRRDHAYMHLRRRASFKKGQRVRTGGYIGQVGKSGNASGCHLHFELWSAPGYYEGGRAMRSVTRQLKSWDRGSKRKR